MLFGAGGEEAGALDGLGGDCEGVMFTEALPPCDAVIDRGPLFDKTIRSNQGDALDETLPGGGSSRHSSNRCCTQLLLREGRYGASGIQIR